MQLLPERLKETEDDCFYMVTIQNPNRNISEKEINEKEKDIEKEIIAED